MISIAHAAHLIKWELRDVNHSFVASRHNAAALRTVVAYTAAETDNVELRLVMQAEVRMQSPHSSR
jgi:hypothetical protein